MKFIFFKVILLLVFFQVSAQVPVFKSKRFYRGVNESPLVIYDIKPTREKGYIIVGTDSTIIFPRERKILNCDCARSFIMKIDSGGNEIWKKSLTVQDTLAISALSSVVEADDGGFVATGVYGNSFSSINAVQLAVVKFSNSGQLLWERKYGGTQNDLGYKISEVSTGGFIITGTSASNNGNVSGNNGGEDVWLLRINEFGSIIWSKLYGGSGSDNGYSVVQTNDYGFVVAGGSLSTNGSLTGNNGSSDGWIFKTDSSGNLQWQKNFGFAANEHFQDVQIDTDNTIILTGHSDASFVNPLPPGHKGKTDVWVVKVTNNGTLLWSKYFGGSDDDYGYTGQILNDNSIVVASTTASSNGDVGISGVQFTPWLLRLSSSGDIIWKTALQLNELIWSYNGFLNVRTEEYIVSGNDFSSFARGVVYRLGSENSIKGVLYLDGNLNNQRDVGESGFNNAKISVTKNNAIVAGAFPNNGIFEIPIDTGSYTTTVQLFSHYYNVVPANRNTNFSTYFNVDSFGFAIQPIPNKQDLQINFTPLSPARPGFKAQYVLNYKNVGTTTIASGSVKLIKDRFATLSLALPAPSSVVADTLSWNYTNLKPLDSIAIGIEFQLAAPPSLNINDTLRYTAVILPVAGDLTPADDTSRLRQRVQGSYDPNDKQENFAGRIPLKNVQDGSYINYIIRFQNTGNDTAFFVRLLDTLDTKLDWNSFQMIGSSHSYNLTIKDGNKLNWFFDNIKLPDSVTNMARSIGYVAFRIKPKNNLSVGNVITNKASIYFDYNLPIVTNTANTIVSIETTTGVREVQTNEMKLVLGPNPANGYSLLQITGKLTGKFELRIIDNNGRIISQQTITRNSIVETIQVPLQLIQFSSGVYYIQLQQKEKSWWQKVLVQ